MVYAITDISESNTIPGCFDNKKVSVNSQRIYIPRLKTIRVIRGCLNKIRRVEKIA